MTAHVDMTVGAGLPEQGSDSSGIPADRRIVRLPVHPATLVFDGQAAHLEKDFRAYCIDRYLPLIRFSHWLAIVFYAAYGLLDIYLFPDHAAFFLVIRLGVVCPLFAIGVVASYMPWYKQIYHYIVFFFVLLAASGYTVMTAMTPVEHSSGYYVGIVACMVFGYAFVRLPVLHATLSGWLIVAIYWLFGLKMASAPVDLMVNQIAYLIGFNLLLMIICYTVERSDRHNFYLSHLLAKEKHKVGCINESLEETVQKRTIALESANWRLLREIEAHKAAQSATEQLTKQLRQAQKMEAVGTLAGGIAHDFNNILGAIMGFTELALEEAEPDSTQLANLEEVMVAGKRARDLVKQILTFSRRDDQSMQPINLTDTIKEVASLLRATLPTSIEIKVRISAHPMIIGDPTQLNQVLMNMGINAWHAMAEKGGALTLRLERAMIGDAFCRQHPGSAPGPHALVTVADTGKGIVPEIMERIFDPFFTTKPQGQGTGLGLSVVHGIIKSHGGAITVSSRPEHGATFCLYLPVLVASAAQETGDDDDLPRGDESILYVDDERALLHFGRQSLSRLGYRVTTRANALEALEWFKAQHRRIDLVITDLSMPYMDGDSLISEIKAIRPDMPTVLCSGLDNRARRRKSEAMGLDAIIAKPVLKTELAQTVRRVLDQRLKESKTSGRRDHLQA